MDDICCCHKYDILNRSDTSHRIFWLQANNAKEVGVCMRANTISNLLNMDNRLYICYDQWKAWLKDQDDSLHISNVAIAQPANLKFVMGAA